VTRASTFSPRNRSLGMATRIGALGLLILAACLHGPQVAPTATLAPEGPDAGPARSRGPFEVVYAAPRGHVADRLQPGVTVLFSRGMRSVETADDQGVPDLSIRTQTGGPVAGAWRWTGTRGLLFSPAVDLPGGSDFVVTVPAGTKSLDGSALPRPYTLDFETDGPRVTAFAAMAPAGTTEEALPGDPAFRIIFDQPVDPAVLEAASSLRVFAGDGDRGESIPMHASKTTLPPTTNPLEAYALLLTPERPLALDHDLELSIKDSLHGTGGPRSMAAPFKRSMHTHGPLRLVDFYCPRITANGRCRAGGDVKVTLSTPVDPAELHAHLHGQPPVRPPAKNEKRGIDPKNVLWLGVAPKLGAAYKMTLTAGMKDIYGQKLAKDAHFDIDVEAPLVKPPAVAVVAPPPPNAPVQPPAPHRPPGSPPDLRPRRERLPYRLDLGLVGQVLEAGGSHRIPVGSVNIPTYASIAAALSEDQATAWMLARGSDFDTRNGLVPTWTLPKAGVDERAVDFLDLDAALAQHHGRGPVLVALQPPGGQGGQQALVTVTDLGVTAKMGPYGGMVWVTQLSTGKPVSGATVGVHTTKDGIVFTGKTDAQGLVAIPVDRFDAMAAPETGLTLGTIRSDAAIIVRSGDDWTLTKVDRSRVEGRLTSDFSLLSKEGQWAGMLFADRGVFRPGETAKVSGIVRVAEPGGLRSVAGRELRVELRDHNSEQIFDGRAKCDDFGTFALDVPIPKSADLGPATITVTAPAGGRSKTAEPGVFSHNIRLLAYKPDEFKVTSESDKPSYVRGDTATFSVTGEYLYGAPMPGASVTSTVSRQEVPFEPPGLEGFTTSDDVFTGDYPDTTKAASEVDSKDDKLDAQGRFTRKVALAFDDQRRPERIVFDADVQDISRREVSARSSVVLHPGEFYVALRSPADRFVAAGSPFHADVLAVEPSGTHRAGAHVKVELVERKWNGVVGEQPDGTPARTSAPVDTVVGSCEAVTADKVSGCDVHVPRAGYFVLRATASDPRGNTVRASAAIYGTEESPQAETAWSEGDRNAIKLEANKKLFEIGDTAKILLRSPFKEGEALVSVERNGVLWQSVVPIKGPLPVVTVPIRPEFYPNAFVSVVAVRGRIQAPPASNTGADLGAPTFRFGYVELNVNPEAHRLHVAVQEPKAEYQPGDMVDADVVVTDAGGKPITSALTFYVVDEGVLALTSYKTPDPLPAFVQSRKLAVFSLDNREILARILAMKAGERLPSLGYEYALARSGGYDKGDDGGDGDAPKRADFRTTAYFEAGRKTDAEGKAHFKFKLPDNLTTFRVMAVAAGGDDRFGSGESKVTTFRRLMARPALPRLIRVGDALEASVIVSSKVETGAAAEPMSVEVRLDAKGLTLGGAPTRTVTMQRGGQAEVRFPVTATLPGDAVLTFVVRSGKDSDKVEMKRHVELPVSVESAAIYGDTSSEASIALGDLRTMRRDQGGLDVRVASTALVGLGSTLDKLIDYPYGCTEQLVSRTLPLLSLLDLAKDFGARLPPDVNATIDGAIESILKNQNDDGGFGFWPQTASEPWLSSYTMLALAGAADKKRFVPADAISRGRDYLTFRLAAATRALGKANPDDDSAPAAAADAGADAGDREKKEIAKEIEFAQGALIGDTLATLGWSNPGALNVLYDAREGQRLFAQAALLHAMAKSDMAAAELKTLSHEIESRLRIGANEVVTDEADTDKYGTLLDSHARTLAMVLRALLAADPHHPLAARIARGLLGMRHDGAWRTTQEDAWSLLALADYRKDQEAGGEEFEGRAYLRGSSILETTFPAGSTREERVFLPADKIAGTNGGTVAFEALGHGQLFYAAELKYASTALPKRPRDEGLFVQKYVRGVAPTEVTEALATIPKKSADAVLAGDLVIVDLLFESAEPRDQVVLDDPLPAGVEALDYDLDTTSQAKAEAEARQNAEANADPKKATWLGTTYRSATSRRQVKDDRVLTFFDHIEPGMYRVHYLARATSVGTFVVPPTRVEAMYVPEVYGRTAASWLAVRAKP